MRILCNSVIVLLTSTVAVGLRIGVTVEPEGLHSLFKQFRYIPDGIDNAPASVLNVKFKEANETAYFDDQSIMTTLIRPVLSWTDTEEGARPDSLYTVVMADIDGGNPHLLLWLVTNILGNDVDHGDQVVPYQYPNPPPTPYTDHRNLILVYRQSTKEPIKVNKKLLLGKNEDRKNFDVQVFHDYYNYTKWPIAGNFFRQFPILQEYDGDVKPWMEPFIPKMFEQLRPPKMARPIPSSLKWNNRDYKQISP